MSSKLGSEPLGKFYTGKKPKKRREWRGLKDTWYDYTRWLGYWKTLITFIIKPNNMKGFFRYRWMMNYLALPDFMDRHTEGMRDLQLRMAHNALGLIVTDICGMLGQIFKADPAIGNDKELNKKIVLFDEYPYGRLSESCMAVSRGSSGVYKFNDVADRCKLLC